MQVKFSIPGFEHDAYQQMAGTSKIVELRVPEESENLTQDYPVEFTDGGPERRSCLIA